MRGVAHRVAPDADLIGKIASRLESPHDGEVVNAARLAVNRLGSLGLRIGDVMRQGVFAASASAANCDQRPDPVRPLRRHQRAIMEIRASGVPLSQWESTFVTSLWTKQSLSERQESILADLLATAREARG